MGLDSACAFLLPCARNRPYVEAYEIKNEMSRHLEKHPWENRLFMALWQELLAMRERLTVTFYSFRSFRGTKVSMKKGILK